MATKLVKDLSERELAELACTYSALLLHDEGVELTAQNFNKVMAAAGVSVKGFWAGLYAKALQGRDVNSLLAVGGGAASSAPVAAPAASTPAPAAPEKKADGKKKEEKKKEAAPAPAEEEEVGMGDLFG
jgi:large subunit ribosomal protein LP1